VAVGAAAVFVVAGWAAPALSQESAVAPAVRAIDTSMTGLFGAMERDLGLNRAQAVRRFADARTATDLATALEPRLGAEYGGAWLDEASGRLAVAVTSEAAADQARAVGAVPQVVRYSLGELQAAKEELDATHRAAPDRMTDAISWGVDPQRNAVVATVRTGRTVQPLVDIVGRRGDQVRVEESEDMPETVDWLDGGDPLGANNNGDYCSVGFNVYQGNTSYLLTAGHCGAVGTNASSKGSPIGPYVHSFFPGDDDALIRNDRLDLWAVGPWIAIHDAADLAYNVTGQTITIINGPMCKSGKTTKITCGNLKAPGQTVNYPAGAVYNLTRHTACVEKGDSGGANFTSPTSVGGVAALGMSSGAALKNGKCLQKSGKTNQSWFAPVGPALSWYGVKLYTI